MLIKENESQSKKKTMKRMIVSFSKFIIYNRGFFWSKKKNRGFYQLFILFLKKPNDHFGYIDFNVIWFRFYNCSIVA